MIDLTCVALSPLAALLIRDNFDTSILRVQALAPYALLCILVGAIVFNMMRLPRSFWRYTSLIDILHLIGAVTVVLLVALAASFYLNRMENVARSLPIIQWFLLISAMAGVRIAVRVLGERSANGRSRTNVNSTTPAYVLLAGVSDLTELYLRSVNKFAQGSVTVVGILSEAQMQGRFMRAHKVLGRPEDVQKILTELDLHGVAVQRIIVMQPFEQLSEAAQAALLAAERSANVEVDWLVEKLGFCRDNTWEAEGPQKAALHKGENQPHLVLDDSALLSREQYHTVKRAIDVAGVISILTLAPVLALLVAVVAIDVGFPLVFWQLRPGRNGRPFKLFKFRTMRPAHDADGRRIPDQLRSSKIGDFLRRSRLDELPQLYNILVGEMSFVGPRPLLPVDQPQWQTSRLVVRPGLTGWAQVNGGRDISPEDKAALDIWYIVNASLWLDITILRRTFTMLVLGERVNSDAVQAARAMLARWEASSLLTLSSPSLDISASGARET